MEELDKFQEKIKKEYEEAEGIKKAGLIAAGVALAPVIGLGKVAENAPALAKEAYEKIKEEARSGQLKKYNPLFPEEYESAEYRCPDLLMLVDDIERREVEVCKGSIGWTSVENGMEVLHLYDKDIETSKLTFIPTATRDAVYFMDPHDNKRFINIDMLYDKIHQQQVAELEDIAFCLGAKSFYIDVEEELSEKVIKKLQSKTKGNVKIVKAEASMDFQGSLNKRDRRASYSTTNLSQRRNPIVPKLTWFKEDPFINNLIKQVCQSDGLMEDKDVTIECSKYAVISRSAAAKIDVAVKKLGVKSSANIEEEAEKEYASKIHFHLEF